MSQLDDLLQRSRAPGRFVERRRFSLSRDKAIEKLREFSLRNPRQYVLELVQAATFHGASYIAIDVDPERMLLAWVGSPPLKQGELEHVFDYLFADRGARPTRHLVQLAIGLNALLQRKPKVLRVESGDGTLDGTVRMDLDRKGNGVVGAPQDPLAGTYILAEFGSSWAARFQGDTWTPEEGLVESECRYTPVPILLNGRAPFGWKASRSISWFGDAPRRSFDDAGGSGRRGVLALADSGPKARPNRGFHLVVGGVRITTTPLPELGELPAVGPQRPEPVGLTGVVCDDNLRKTADQSDIVRDTRFSAMLHAVQPHATSLLREIEGGGYVPPRLPELAASDHDDEEPVPDPVPQLLPRPTVSVVSLAGLADGAPCFWVHPDDAKALWSAGDPARFPHPVLVLTPGQVETLDRLAPQLALHRLTSPADVDFVRRALEQRLRVRVVSVPFAGPPSGRLELTLTLDGPQPLWGDPEAGDVAVRVSAHGRTSWCTMEPLGLPGLAVALELDAPAESVTDALAAEVGERALAEAWRLLPERVAPVDREALRRFATGLLATHARPQFVREAGEATRLTTHLPVGWGPAEARLRGVPLARTAQGPLTLARLEALQGTDASVDLLDPDDLERLAPLEERLGFGHLRVPALLGLLAVVARTPGGWRPWDAPRWDVDGVDAVLGLSLTAGPLPEGALPDGWHATPVGLGRVVHLSRGGAPVDPLPGLVLLRQRVRRLARDAGPTPAEVDPLRLESAARLADLHLAGHLDQLDGLAALHVARDGRKVSLSEAEDWPDFAVSPRHGPVLDEPHTALLSFDELVALERHREAPLPLRFDDAPGVWASLAAPSSEDWLLRHEVAIPGLRGWLGLRLPFDASSGVFLQGTGTLVALTHLDRRVPVHGLLWLTTAQLRPTRQQTELLQLARQLLYQELVDLLARGLEPGRRAAARRYAMAFAHAAWLETGGRLLGTAAHFADTVAVAGPEGGDWGSLRRWLEAEPAGRPPLPIPLRPGAAADPPARRAISAELAAVAQRMERRLQRAAGPALGGAHVRIDLRGPDGDAVKLDRAGSDITLAQVRVSQDHPLLARLARGDAAAEELLLLCAARELSWWAQRTGYPVDLLEVQRVLVAQRLS